MVLYKKGVGLKRKSLNNADVQTLIVLGYPDSNQERQDQNLQCYHYTISQCRVEETSVEISFPHLFECKGTAFVSYSQIFLLLFSVKSKKNSLLDEIGWKKVARILAPGLVVMV